AFSISRRHQQNGDSVGDPPKPGMYVRITKRGPNEWSQPHSHPNERYITVLAGTFFIGPGAQVHKKNNLAIGTRRRSPRYPKWDALRRNGARGRHARVHSHGSSGEELTK